MTMLIDVPERLAFPKSWKRESRERLSALGITQSGVDEIEAGLARFRRIRDEVAAERYRVRGPELRRLVNELRNELSPLVARRAWMLKTPEHQRTEDWKTKLQTLDEAIARIGQQYQDADAELALINRDYPLRLARLGIK